MQVIGAYTSTIFLLDFMENVILLHNPLPYVWESLHLGLATITVLLVVAYLTYITIKVYSVSGRLSDQLTIIFLLTLFHAVLCIIAFYDSKLVFQPLFHFENLRGFKYSSCFIFVLTTFIYYRLFWFYKKVHLMRIMRSAQWDWAGSASFTRCHQDQGGGRWSCWWCRGSVLSSLQQNSLSKE